MLLAGDLGGTKTLLGLFRQTGTARPEMVVTHEFATLDFPGADDILGAFLQKVDVAADAIDAACFGVPGPVIDQRVQPTNVDWAVDARELHAKLKLKHVHLLEECGEDVGSTRKVQRRELMCDDHLRSRGPRLAKDPQQGLGPTQISGKQHVTSL